MSRYGKILNEMDALYASFSNDPEYLKLRNNIPMLISAQKHGLALGGSTGMHYGHYNPSRLPGDLDFITKDLDSAWLFLKDYYKEVSKYKHHGKMYIQNNTSWCPDGTTAHFRLESTIHIEICIMVLSEEIELNKWYTKAGVCVQDYNDIAEAAKKLTERDGKPRMNTVTEKNKEEDEENPFTHIKTSKPYRRK